MPSSVWTIALFVLLAGVLLIAGEPSAMLPRAVRIRPSRPVRRQPSRRRR
jgi:hypothetical protein